MFLLLVWALTPLAGAVDGVSSVERRVINLNESVGFDQGSTYADQAGAGVGLSAEAVGESGGGADSHAYSAGPTGEKPRTRRKARVTDVMDIESVNSKGRKLVKKGSETPSQPSFANRSTIRCLSR